MRRSILAFTGLLAPAFLLLAGGQAAAQPQALDLSTLTCAQAMAEEPPIPTRRLVPAMAGVVAARAGHARLPSDAELAQFGTGLRQGCANDPTRPVAMIALLQPSAQAAESDRDIARMTCATLGPVWRREANQIVPFIAGLLAPEGRLAANGMDRVGNGLQAACREPVNAQQTILDVVALLP
ncbi:hypothetical protein ACQW02_20265 [Humitalea sp. 24SJ18S-53]|uniref:hypothetical protein n=1 Tax=Humitalea sp. 24SJ18S-53 TaxID=3422307 RepID=UPI003D672ED9